MSVIGSNILAGSAGSGGDALYVDDLFSTTLYEGTGSSGNTVDTGIEFDEKWLIWQKNRSGVGSNLLTDSSMTKTTNEYPSLLTNTTSAESTTGGPVTISGSTVEYAGGTNNSGATHALWSFKGAPGFFDVVTYTGTGSARTVAHNLGSVPGMIWIKCTSEAADWSVYHRSMGATKNMHLNNSTAADTQTGVFNDTEPTATNFTVNTDTDVNGSGKTYVAYLFAHNDQSFGTDGDEAIVHCGTFNGGGVLNSNTIEVNTGFEPQFVLIKRTDSTSDWYLYDTMRGMADDGFNDPQLVPNSTGAEATAFRFWVYQNGFAFDEDLGGSSAEWIYMAIRRPNKPPEAGTDVYSPVATTSATGTKLTTGFPVDWQLVKDNRTGSNNIYALSRLAGVNTRESANNFPYLNTGSTAAEATSGLSLHWDNTGYKIPTSFGGNSSIYWNFRRAPGFFDVVLYTGNLSTNNVAHNLESVPELIIIKRRDSAEEWPVYSSALGNTKYLVLNSIGASSTNADYWNSTTPTSTQFTLGARQETNASGGNFIAYLFATLPGISKVGSYTGTGSDINVDCDFTAGARFVLIKRTDVFASWYVWDSVRGIVAGNDPYLILNSSAAEVTNLDYIDPLNAGFTVTSSASAELNASGGTYAFLAIA